MNINDLKVLHKEYVMKYGSYLTHTYAFPEYPDSSPSSVEIEENGKVNEIIALIKSIESNCLQAHKDYYIAHGYFMDMHECYASLNGTRNIDTNDRVVQKLRSKYPHIEITTFPYNPPWYASYDNKTYHDKIGVCIKPENFLYKQ